MRLLFCLSVLLCACGPEEPVGLDMAGRYNVQLDGINGCENDPELVAWMLGPLAVSGEPDALVFDFGEGFSFDGSVSESARFSYIGTAKADTAEYSVSGGGTLEGVPESYRLDGEGVSTISDDGTLNCSISTIYSAVQIAE